MKPQSAKAKGRALQKWTRDTLLKLYEKFTPDDIRSTAMGQSGVDIQFSSAAKEQIPFAIECKNKARIAVYQWLDQAKTNAGNDIPIVVMKQNHGEPLVVVDAKWFFEAFKYYGMASKGK